MEEHRAPSAEDSVGTIIAFRVYENQRWYPIRGWSTSLLPTDRSGFSDKAGKQTFDCSKFPMPPGYAWIDQEWTRDVTENTDAEGWRYAVDFPAHFHREKSATSMVRRRQLVRRAVRVSRNGPPVSVGEDFVDAAFDATARSASGIEPAASDTFRLAPAPVDPDAPLPLREPQHGVTTTASADHAFESLLAKFANEDTEPGAT